MLTPMTKSVCTMLDYWHILQQLIKLDRSTFLIYVLLEWIQTTQSPKITVKLWPKYLTDKYTNRIGVLN